MHPNAWYSVFLSHNHADQPAVAEIARRLAEAGLHPWFAASHLIPGEPRQEAMEAALAASETVAVFVGPQGMGPWHNEEMRVAIDDAVQKGKRVIPVLLPGADPERINPFLKRRTWVDFRADPNDETAFQLLIAGIRGDAPFEATGLFGFGWRQRHDFYRLDHNDLPPNYIPRSELLAEVRERLIAGTGGLALTSAIQVMRANVLHGMGGIGKSVLARALCDDPDVQAAFPDGILWATLGQTPDLTKHLREWIDTLGGIVGQTAPTLDQLRNMLAEALQDKACLLIVDDAWRKAHLEPFCAGGPRCRLLITTRDAALAEGLDARVYPVPVMAPDQAVALLEEWAQGSLAQVEAELKAKIVRRLGRLPLAAQLAGAQLRRKDPAEWLASFDARKLKTRRVEKIHDSLEATFALSLDALDPAARRLYAALAIFKEDEAAPVVVIARLWSAMDGRGTDETGELLYDLADRALLVRTRGNGDAVTVHNLLRDFMAAELGEEERIAAHRALLDAYRRTQQGAGWHTIPADGYMHSHLTWHMEQAEQGPAIHTLLQEETVGGRNGWFEARQRLGQTAGFLTDVERAWRLAQVEYNERHSAVAVGRQCRYALTICSVRSLASNIPPALLAELVAKEIWAPSGALEYASQLSDAERRVRTLSSLSIRLAELGLVREALEAARAISDVLVQEKTLVAVAVKAGDAGRVAEAFVALREIRDQEKRGLALLGVAPYLLEGDSIRDAVNMAGSMQDNPDLWQALAAAISRLVDLGQLPLAQAIAREIQCKPLRGLALAFLVPHLSEPQCLENLREALDLIKSTNNEAIRFSVLGMTACRFAQMGRRTESLVVVQNIDSAEERLRVSAKLVPLLAHANHVQEALALAHQLQPGPQFLNALAEMAPSLADAKRDEVLGQALGTVRQTQDGGYWIEALIGFAPHLTKPLLEEMVAFVLQNDSTQRRTEVLTGLVPNLPERLFWEMLFGTPRTKREILEGLTTLNSLLPESDRIGNMQEALRQAPEVPQQYYLATVLVGLAPFRPKEISVKALGAVQEIQDERFRSEALIWLAPYLSEELSEKALALVLEIEDPQRRAEVLIGLASNSKLSLPLLGATLKLTLAINDEEQRVKALGKLTPSLPQQLLQQLFVSVGDIKGEEYRASLLAAMAPYLHDQALLGQALDIVQEFQTVRNAQKALAGLVRHLPESLMQKALSVATAPKDREIEDPVGAQLRASGHFSDPWLNELQAGMHRLRYLLDKSLKLAGPAFWPIWWPAFRETTAATTDTVRKPVPEPGLETIAPYLSASLLQQALAEILDIRDEYHRLQTLTRLALCLPDSTRSQILAQVVAAVRHMHRASHQLETLASLAPHVTEPLLEEALTIASGIEEPEIRMQALIELIPRVADLQHPDDALDLVFQIADEDYRACALVELIPHLRRDLREQAIQLALAMAEKQRYDFGRTLLKVNLAALLAESGKTSDGFGLARHLPETATSYSPRALAVAALAPYLPNHLLLEALAVARALPEGDLLSSPRAVALAGLGPYLPEPHLREVLQLSLQLKNQEARALTLSVLAPCLAELGSIDEAMAMAGTIEDDTCRTLAQIQLVMDMSDVDRARVLDEILKSTAKYGLELPRRWALAAISDQLLQPSSGVAYRLLFETLPALASRLRPDILSDIGALSPAIMALGGSEAIAETIRAIHDVCRWWP